MRRYQIREPQLGTTAAYLPVVTCVIRECLDVDSACTFTDAGYDLGGVYVPDFDLQPLSEMHVETIEQPEDDDGRRHRQHDPGE